MGTVDRAVSRGGADPELAELFQNIEEEIPFPNTVPDLKASLQDALAKANRLVPSEAGSVYLFRPRRDELVIAVSYGASAPSVESKAVPRNRGFAGYSFENGPLLANDVQSDTRFYRRIETEAKFTTRSVLCTPLEVGGRRFGVIQLLNRLGEPGAAVAYTERDLELLNVLAQLITQSISHASAAARDPLTGLYNSRSLHEHLGKELAASRLTGDEFCVLFLDLDHFKQVNDRYGHQIGSRTLIAVARLLRENTRQHDFIARYGGDEFILVIPSCTVDEGVAIAEKIRRKIEATSFFKEEGYDLAFLTSSIGCASSRDSGDDRDVLLGLADTAMYQAKVGRNRVVVLGREALGKPS